MNQICLKRTLTLVLLLVGLTAAQAGSYSADDSEYWTPVEYRLVESPGLSLVSSRAGRYCEVLSSQTELHEFFSRTAIRDPNTGERSGPEFDVDFSKEMVCVLGTGSVSAQTCRGIEVRSVRESEDLFLIQVVHQFGAETCPPLRFGLGLRLIVVPTTVKQVAVDVENEVDDCF